MAMAIFLIVLSGVMITGTLKGWFDNEKEDKNRIEYTVSQDEIEEKVTEFPTSDPEPTQEKLEDRQREESAQEDEQAQTEDVAEEKENSSAQDDVSESPKADVPKESKNAVSKDNLPEKDNTVSTKQKKEKNTDGSKKTEQKIQESTEPDRKKTHNPKTEPKETVKSEEPKESKTEDALTCSIEIRCDSILNNMSDLKKGKKKYVPSSGCILSKTEVEFSEGETVFDVLKKVCNSNSIQLEYSWTPIYDSYYIEGIHQLYEFDCGSESGWMYQVNGTFPNYGCSSYTLNKNDVIKWSYTCKGLGADIGASMN